MWKTRLALRLSIIFLSGAVPLLWVQEAGAEVGTPQTAYGVHFAPPLLGVSAKLRGPAASLQGIVIAGTTEELLGFEIESLWSGVGRLLFYIARSSGEQSVSVAPYIAPHVGIWGAKFTRQLGDGIAELGAREMDVGVGIAVGLELHLGKSVELAAEAGVHKGTFEEAPYDLNGFFWGGGIHLRF